MEKNGEKKSIKMNDVVAFFKKNMYLVLMIVCILALGTVVTIAAVVNSNEEVPQIIEDENNQELETKEPEKEEEEPIKNVENIKPNESEPVINEEKFYIIAPLSTYSIDQQFSNTALVWNATQKHWATHEGIDFKADAGTKVKCVYDGKVESVDVDNYNGTTIVISHKNGFTSVYKLLDKPLVKAGDKVSRGQIIGEVSKNALSEIADGPHLHFELLKDGKRIDPMEYLLEGGK